MLTADYHMPALRADYMIDPVLAYELNLARKTSRPGVGIAASDGKLSARYSSNEEYMGVISSISLVDC